MAELGTNERVILLVDDSEDDTILIRRAFERAGLKHRLQVVSGGLDAVAYLSGETPYFDRFNYPLPDMVLLDIKMPAMDGFDVLQWIRQEDEFENLCVVMLTSSNEIRDVNQAYRLGATSFFVKPLDFSNSSELTHSLNLLLSKRP